MGTEINMRGAIFRNKKKEREEQPDFTGSAKVDSKDYYISAWVNHRDGDKYISLSFSVKPDDKPVTEEDIHDLLG